MIKQERARPSKGYSLTVVLIFLILLFALWSAVYRSTSSLLRIETNRVLQQSRDEGAMTALAQALQLLQYSTPSGLDESQPYSIHLRCQRNYLELIRFLRGSQLYRAVHCDAPAGAVPMASAGDSRKLRRTAARLPAQHRSGHDSRRADGNWQQTNVPEASGKTVTEKRIKLTGVSSRTMHKDARLSPVSLRRGPQASSRAGEASTPVAGTNPGGLVGPIRRHCDPWDGSFHWWRDHLPCSNLRLRRPGTLSRCRPHSRRRPLGLCLLQFLRDVVATVSVFTAGGRRLNDRGLGRPWLPDRRTSNTSARRVKHLLSPALLREVGR